MPRSSRHWIGRGLLIWIACVLLQSPGVLGADIESQFLFLDRQIEDKSDIWRHFQKDPSKPWEPEEKQAFLVHLRYVAERSQGLVERAVAVRPLRVYRVKRLEQDSWKATYSVNDHGIRITDDTMSRMLSRQFNSDGAHTLAHELAHAADTCRQFSWSKEWVAMVKPRVDRVRGDFVKRADRTEWFPDLQNSEHAALLSGLARKQGLPSGYASKNLGESLADSVAFMVIHGHAPPRQIAEFIEANLLTRPTSEQQSTRLVHQALIAREKGEKDDAIRAVSEAIQEDPSLSFAYCLRAMCLQGKDNERAMADFGRAIELAPEPFREAFFKRAIWYAYAMKNHEEEAIANIDRYLNEYPRDSEFYALRASVWMKVKMPHKALPDCVKALRCDPDEGTAKMNQMFAIQQLRLNLRDKDPAVRLVAAQSVGELAAAGADLPPFFAKAITPALEAAQEDKDPKVRQAAAHALQKLQAVLPMSSEK